MTFDFEKLTRETFEHCDQLKGKNPFDEASESDNLRFTAGVDDYMDALDIIEEEQNPNRFPATVGIIFKIEKGLNTFCLRTMASENMALDYEKIKANLFDPMLKRLKLSDEQDVSSLLFFETEDLDLAEIICDQMGGRRFPLDEDSLCNLSDPGFSWWLSEEEGGFRIYFKSHGLNRAGRFIKLGPLGDRKIASRRFSELLAGLGDMGLEDFYCDDKCFGVFVEDEMNSTYKDLYSLFKKGEGYENLSGENLTLSFYLRELAFLRRFWRLIEQSL